MREEAPCFTPDLIVGCKIIKGSVIIIIIIKNDSIFKGQQRRSGRERGKEESRGEEEEGKLTGSAGVLGRVLRLAEEDAVPADVDGRDRRVRVVPTVPERADGARERPELRLALGQRGSRASIAGARSSP